MRGLDLAAREKTNDKYGKYVIECLLGHKPTESGVYVISCAYYFFIRPPATALASFFSKSSWFW